MAISLRIPVEKEKIIRELAQKEGKTKTAFVLEAIDEKIAALKDRQTRIRQFSGWMSHEEAQELRQTMDIFNRVHEGDWE
jgi:uncharacterized protein (DUF1778 family)